MSATVTLVGSASGDGPDPLWVGSVTLADGDYLLVASISGGGEDPPAPDWGGVAWTPMDATGPYNHVVQVNLYGPATAGTHDLNVTNDGDVPHGAALALKLSGFDPSAFDVDGWSWGGNISLGVGSGGSTTPVAGGETAVAFLFVDGPTSDGEPTFADGWAALGWIGTTGDGDPTADVTLAAACLPDCTTDAQDSGAASGAVRGIAIWLGLFKPAAPAVVTAFDGSSIALIAEPAPSEVTVYPPSYPLFPERVNGAHGVDETLSFITDVMVARTLTEQRMALRAVPVRELRFICSARDQDAADRMLGTLWSLGNDPVYVPLWCDARPLLVAIPPSTSSYVVYFDAANADVSGNLVVLWAGPEQYEELLATAVYATGITAQTRPLAAYAAGVTSVVPIVSMQLVEAAATPRPNAAAVDVALAFRVVQP